MKKIIFSLLVISATFNLSKAQQTVGVFLNSPQAFDGYTLFSPTSSTTTYLINNCGEMVHSWTGSQLPGISAYLIEDGLLYRPGRSPGGGSPLLEVLDWNSNVVWSLATQPYGPTHHDIEILPNGNILMIVQDLRSSTEVTQVGGSYSGTLKSEKIIEIQPDFNTGGVTLVWEWYAWDHLIQDVDPTKLNYGVIANSPGRVDINAYSTPGNGDWLHFNGIDYNAQFDQIVISTPRFNEIWIIDHSTSVAEAASSIGGNSGKGGDLLYRWGNPLMYGQGTSADQKLFFQHHPNWIPSSFPDGDKIIIFNNRAGEAVGQNYSAVNIIDPQVDINGNYTYSGGAFGPVVSDWTYLATPATSFYSNVISGAEQLPNGNVLICEGITGRLFEVDQSMNTVWEYINPVGTNGIPISQYSTPSSNHNVFRTIRYAPDYLAFVGKILTPQGYIESGSSISCTLYPACAPIDLNFNFDGFPEQTTWEILDDSNTSVASGGGYLAGDISITENLCLTDGCYILNVYDAFNNGMCPFQSNAVGVSTFITQGTLVIPGSIVGTLSLVATTGLCGNYELTDANGNTLVSGGANFGSQQSNSFCLTGGLEANLRRGKQDIVAKMINNFTISPNPVMDRLTLFTDLNIDASPQIQILDVLGKVVMDNILVEPKAQQFLLDVSTLDAGVYFMMIHNSEKLVAKKFLKQ